MRASILALAVTLGLIGVGCGGDDDGPTNPGGTADVTISIPPGAMSLGSNAYNPDTATVAVGQTVRWVNNDATAHTATAGSFDTGTIAPNGGRSAIITITGSSGVREYNCSIHPAMTGWLNVTP